MPEIASIAKFLDIKINEDPDFDYQGVIRYKSGTGYVRFPGTSDNYIHGDFKSVLHYLILTPVEKYFPNALSRDGENIIVHEAVLMDRHSRPLIRITHASNLGEQADTLYLQIAPDMASHPALQDFPLKTLSYNQTEYLQVRNDMLHTPIAHQLEGRIQSTDGFDLWLIYYGQNFLVSQAALRPECRIPDPPLYAEGDQYLVNMAWRVPFQKDPFLQSTGYPDAEQALASLKHLREDLFYGIFMAEQKPPCCWKKYSSSPLTPNSPYLGLSSTAGLSPNMKLPLTPRTI
ncbi:hypothetical protein MKQ70_32380 [Chitinophaga sedimenti]|uniref:hypothetical protein n=1 Tax=Chitinophaga sedimenti TaxID=2033606 RepID=UPI00200575DA|nr:hypothetical protein [Chitinophaga sedimenti]MCK7559415.1 hypothetical protein [Chitinophaga sedimenti]